MCVCSLVSVCLLNALGINNFVPVTVTVARVFCFPVLADHRSPFVMSIYIYIFVSPYNRTSERALVGRFREPPRFRECNLSRYVIRADEHRSGSAASLGRPWRDGPRNPLGRRCRLTHFLSFPLSLSYMSVLLYVFAFPASHGGSKPAAPC